MDEIIKIFILGVVQGITEFLPVSSTGHLLVTSALLRSEVAERLGGTFEIFIQFGSVLAVIGFYRADLWRQVTTVRRDRDVQWLWVCIIIASIPAAVAGFLFRDFIKSNIFPADTAPFVVATMLITVGLIFILVESRRNVDESQLTAQLGAISFKQAVLVGMAQACALVPGVSRSGASIIGALLSGMNRQVATTFSFYLAIPVLGGATVLDLLLSLDDIETADLTYLAIGTIVTAVVSWVAIGWLLRYISSSDFTIFGYYRIFAGIVIFALLVINVL